MALSDHVSPGPGDRAMAWMLPKLRTWEWFPDFFRPSRIIRVNVIDTEEAESLEMLQVGAVSFEADETVSEVSYEMMKIRFGYVYETTHLAIPDGAVTHLTVLDELSRFINAKPVGENSHSTLGGMQGVNLARYETVNVGIEERARQYRFLSMLEATYRIHRDVFTQEN